MKLTQKQIDCFWSKVDIRGEDECWEWKAGKFWDGYGNYRNHKAHRIAFLIAYGRLPVPQGLHSCDNRSCVNPKHIHEGTQKKNVEEARERGRMSVGEKHPVSKLTVSQVLEIREAGGSQAEIARTFGIAPQTVQSIKAGTRWKHLFSGRR